MSWFRLLTSRRYRDILFYLESCSKYAARKPYSNDLNGPECSKRHQMRFLPFFSGHDHIFSLLLTLLTTTCQSRNPFALVALRRPRSRLPPKSRLRRYGSTSVHHTISAGPRTAWSGSPTGRARAGATNPNPLKESGIAAAQSQGRFYFFWRRGNGGHLRHQRTFSGKLCHHFPLPGTALEQ